MHFQNQIRWNHFFRGTFALFLYTYGLKPKSLGVGMLFNNFRPALPRVLVRILYAFEYHDQEGQKSTLLLTTHKRDRIHRVKKLINY